MAAPPYDDGRRSVVLRWTERLRSSSQPRLPAWVQALGAIALSAVGLALGWHAIFTSFDAPGYPAVPVVLMGASGASCYFARKSLMLFGMASGAAVGALAGLALNTLGGYALQGF